nr:MAG TPA: hypothetical protein [Caudoviricetes sp.]
MEYMKQWLESVLRKNKKRVGARSLRIRFKDIFVLEYKEKNL